jgi:hypothetical protein
MVISVVVGLTPTPGTWNYCPEFMVGTYTVINSTAGGIDSTGFVNINFPFPWPYASTPNVAAALTKLRSN